MSGPGDPDDPYAPDGLPPLADLDLGTDHAIASVPLGAGASGELAEAAPRRPGTAELAPDDVRWMGEALAMAEHGLDAGELPIGAVVVAGGRVVGRAFTQERTQGRLLVHAELLALDQADRTHEVARAGTTLYTTLEPCLMCLGAAATAMVERVVFALPSPGDGGTVISLLWEAHRAEAAIALLRLPPVLGGVRAADSRRLFRRFQEQRDPEDPLGRWAAALVAQTDPTVAQGELSATPPAAGSLAPSPELDREPEG